MAFTIGLATALPLIFEQSNSGSVLPQSQVSCETSQVFLWSQVHRFLPLNGRKSQVFVLKAPNMT